MDTREQDRSNRCLNESQEKLSELSKRISSLNRATSKMELGAKAWGLPTIGDKVGWLTDALLETIKIIEGIEELQRNHLNNFNVIAKKDEELFNRIEGLLGIETNLRRLDGVRIDKLTERQKELELQIKHIREEGKKEDL